MQTAESVAFKMNNADTLLNFYGAYTGFLYNQQNFARALLITQKQLRLSLKKGNLKKQANAYNNMAVQHRVMGNFKLAAKYLLNALKIAEQIGDTIGQKKFYNNLSSIFIDIGDQKNSMFYAKKSYAYAVLLKDSLLIAKSLSNLAISEILNADLNLAESHLNQQVSMAKAIGENELLIESYINLGELYVKQKRFQTAINSYHAADSIAVRYPGHGNEMYISYGLAWSYFHLKNYVLARQFIKSALISADSSVPKYDIKDVYKLSSEIFEKLGQPAKALLHWKKYRILNDSLSNVSIQSAVREMEVKYNSSVKKRSMAEQQLQIIHKNIELQKKNKVIQLVIILILLLLSAVSIIWLYSKGKTQQIQLNLLKAQIHPHFLFNTLNNLYALSINKSDQSPAVVLGLANILRYILYECDHQKVNLADELSAIEQYISIEKIRYGERLEINLDFKGSVTGQKIAPLLILPLVENAFKHGAGKMEAEAWIKIEINISPDLLLFKISNNKPQEETGGIRRRKKGHAGLINIRKRLQILYPKAHIFKILTEDDIFMVIVKVKFD